MHGLAHTASAWHGSQWAAGWSWVGKLRCLQAAWAVYKLTCSSHLMYQCYVFFYMCICTCMVAWQITLKLVSYVESFIMWKCITNDNRVLMVMRWGGSTNEHEMRRTSQLIYSSSGLKTPELSCPASACSSLATASGWSCMCQTMHIHEWG